MGVKIFLQAMGLVAPSGLFFCFFVFCFLEPT